MNLGWILPLLAKKYLTLDKQVDRIIDISKAKPRVIQDKLRKKSNTKVNEMINICSMSFREKANVLYIYETEKDRKQVKTWLEDLDFQVSAVRSFKAALRSLRSNDPDIIITPPVVDNQVISIIGRKLESLVDGSPSINVIARKSQVADLEILKKSEHIGAIYERPLNKSRFIKFIKNGLGMDTVFSAEPVPFREGLEKMGIFELVFSLIDPLHERNSPNAVEQTQFFRNFSYLENLGGIYLDEMVEKIIENMWGSRKVKQWGNQPARELKNLGEVLGFYSDYFPSDIKLTPERKAGLRYFSYFKNNKPPKRGPKNQARDIYDDLLLAQTIDCQMKMIMLEEPKGVPLYLIQVRGTKGYLNALKKIKRKIKEYMKDEMTVFDMNRLKHACFKSADYFAMTLFTKTDDQIPGIDKQMSAILENVYNIRNYIRRDKLGDKKRSYIKYRVPMFPPLNLEILIGSFQTRVLETEMFGPNRRVNYALRKGKASR